MVTLSPRWSLLALLLVACSSDDDNTNRTNGDAIANLVAPVTCPATLKCSGIADPTQADINDCKAEFAKDDASISGTKSGCTDAQWTACANETAAHACEQNYVPTSCTGCLVK